MRSLTPAVDTLAHRIREEFDEAPGLQLTVAEGARFWALDVPTCARVLALLQTSGFLVQERGGRYRRARSV